MERSTLTDYVDDTGYSLEDICKNLKELRCSAETLIQKLNEYKSQTTINEEKLEDADDIISFIDWSIELFNSFLFDCRYIIKEIPYGVTDAHIEILSQSYNKVKYYDKSYNQFKVDNFNNKNFRDESMHLLLDKIYEDTRNEMLILKDFYTVISRLKVLKGKKPQTTFQTTKLLVGQARHKARRVNQ